MLGVLVVSVIAACGVGEFADDDSSADCPACATFAPRATWGVHTRVSATWPELAEPNAKVLGMLLSRIAAPHRIAIADQVTTSEGNGICGEPGGPYAHLDPGIDQWHCGNLVRFLVPVMNAAKDKVVAVIRLDAGGMVNVDPRQPQRVATYKTAVAKFITFWRIVAPEVPLQIIIGNEPDLDKERSGWSWGPSDGSIQGRKTWMVSQVAPLLGGLMRDLAAEHPDTLFITAALSGEMMSDPHVGLAQGGDAAIPFSAALFGGPCPSNVALGLHGYAGDNTAGGRSEARLTAMRALGCKVAAGELGSSAGDSARMVGQGLAHAAIAWIFLSSQHLARVRQLNPYEDNAYAFQADANGDTNQPVLIELAGYGNSI